MARFSHVSFLSSAIILEGRNLSAGNVLNHPKRVLFLFLQTLLLSMEVDDICQNDVVFWSEHVNDQTAHSARTSQ